MLDREVIKLESDGFFFATKSILRVRGGIFGDGFFSSFYETAKDNLQIDSLLEIG